MHMRYALNTTSVTPANGDDVLRSGKRNSEADLTVEKTNKIPKDVFLNEAVNILSDEVGLLKENPKLADSILPKLVHVNTVLPSSTKVRQVLIAGYRNVSLSNPG